MTPKEKVKSVYPNAFLWKLSETSPVAVVSYSPNGERIILWCRSVKTARMAWKVAWERVQRDFLEEMET